MADGDSPSLALIFWIRKSTRTVWKDLGPCRSSYMLSRPPCHSTIASKCSWACVLALLGRDAGLVKVLSPLYYVHSGFLSSDSDSLSILEVTQPVPPLPHRDIHHLLLFTRTLPYGHIP